MRVYVCVWGGGGGGPGRFPESTVDRYYCSLEVTRTAVCKQSKRHP